MKKMIAVFIVFICVQGVFAYGLRYMKKIKLPDEFFSITDFCEAKGNVVLLDRRGCQVYFNKKAKNIHGQGPGECIMPQYLLKDRVNGNFLIFDYSKRQVNIYDSNFIFKNSFKVFQTPYSIAFFNGRIAINFRLSKNNISVFDTKGKKIFETTLSENKFDPNKLSSLLGKLVAFDKKENLFICDVVSGEILKTDKNGRIILKQVILNPLKGLDKVNRNARVNSPFDSKILKIAKRMKKIKRVLSLQYSQKLDLMAVLKREKGEESILLLTPDNLEKKGEIKLKNDNYSTMKISGDKVFLLDEEGEFLDVFQVY